MSKNAQQTSLKSQNWQYKLIQVVFWYSCISYSTYLHQVLIIDKLQLFKNASKVATSKKKHPSFSKTQALPRPLGFFCRFSALFWKGQNTGRCEDPIQKKTRRGNQITNCLVQKQANFEKWLFIKFAVCKRKSRNHLKKYYHPPKTNMTM